MRVGYFTIVVGLLLTVGVVWAAEPEPAPDPAHATPGGGGEPRVQPGGGRYEAKGADSKTPELTEYIPCTASEEYPPEKAPSHELLSAMIVRLKGQIRFATQTDLKNRNTVECATVLTDDKGRADGLFEPYYSDHYGCRSNIAQSIVPGTMIHQRGIVPTLRYKGMRIFNRGPVTLVPGPCADQEERTLLAIRTREGAEEFRGFKYAPKQKPQPLTEFETDKLAEEELKALLNGPTADEAKKCLLAYEQKKRTEESEDEESRSEIPKGGDTPGSIPTH